MNETIYSMSIWVVALLLATLGTLTHADWRAYQIPIMLGLFFILMELRCINRKKNNFKKVSR